MKHVRIGCPIAPALGLGLVSVLILATSALADDWPQWRGPNRDGISKETGWLANWPADGPKKLWEASVGVGYSSFSVSKGRVFTMGNVAENDNVFCFDAETGKLNWKHEYPCLSKDPNGYLGTRCTPTVDGDRVYTVSRQGNFLCLATSDGAVKWSKDFKKDFGSQPGRRALFPPVQHRPPRLPQDEGRVRALALPLENQLRRQRHHAHHPRRRS